MTGRMDGKDDHKRTKPRILYMKIGDKIKIQIDINNDELFKQYGNIQGN